MKTVFSVLVAMATLLAAPAFATQPTQNPCGNSGNNCNVGGSGGNGGAGGSSTAIAGAAAGASASNDIRNTNSNLNAQGQQQGQSQSSNSAVKNSGNSASVSGAYSGGNTQSNAGNNTTVSVGGDTYAAQERNPVSTAYAPAISPTAVCALSLSGGAQGSVFGFSLGGSYIDKNCEHLEQVRRANEIGQKEVAAEMMMDVPAYRDAAKRIADRKAGKPASTSFSTAPAQSASTVQPQYTDPIVRRRLGLPPL